MTRINSATGFTLSMFVLIGAPIVIVLARRPSHHVAAAPSAPPSASASAAPIYDDDFDVAKKNRQIAWCEHHGGVPTMTFTRDRSNVLCLKPQAIIALPGGP